ncbi:hypothetical protein FE236_02215 [Mariprofundus erugo]|uniref:tyrosine-type recombinase/integrase n=1 Tax=Mariprofundus erugo TaxID=2528639 RepID=UPI0010FE7C9F|nr:tyrosine-type recombinase/integrase [Mariprofundus erugo]TLS77936.1 hypothetical protein FE236_02215 [Mariprofundus erugo]
MASIQKRTLDNGQTRWLLQVRKKGYKTVNETKLTKAAAERRAREIEMAMDNGTWDEFATAEQKSGNTSLEYFIHKYLKEISPHKKGGEKGVINETSTLNQVLRSPLGQMDVYRIKSGHVIELRNVWRDRDGNALSTINRKLTTLQDVFTHIQRDWRHENLGNPVKGTHFSFKKGGATKPKARNRTLSQDELVTMRAALDQCQSPYVRWLFDFALETAGRRRELLENKWVNVSTDMSCLKITEDLSKTSVERFIPLTPTAKALLNTIKEHQKDSPSEYIFPITEKAFVEAWKKAYKRSKLKGFQFRDTRHMATKMLTDIYPKMQDLAKITGHEQLETLLGYYNEDVDEQVARMSQFFSTKLL